MSYESWIYDVGHEVDSALRLHLGQELGEHDFNPAPQVVDAVTGFAQHYDAHYDRHMILEMADRLGSMSVVVPDRPHVNISREMKKHFITYIGELRIEDSAVFRWFMVHAHSLEIEIADAEAIRLAFNSYWCEQFANLLGFIVKHALDRDRNDDDYYDLEKDGSLDFDE